MQSEGRGRYYWMANMGESWSGRQFHFYNFLCVCYILVLCETDAEAEETTECQTYNTIVFYVTYQLRLKKQVNDQYNYKVATQR
jgi:hypothetical protein